MRMAGCSRQASLNPPVRVSLLATRHAATTAEEKSGVFVLEEQSPPTIPVEDESSQKTSSATLPAMS
jgi:hypothetical protein